MFMQGLNVSIYQLVMANSICWYGHVLRREGGRILRRALDFEAVGHRKKLRPKRTWKRQVEDEGVKIGFSRKDALCQLIG